MIQVLRGGNVASNSNIEDVSSFLKQQKPSVTVNIEASTLYKVCSVSRSELGPSDDSFGTIQATFRKCYHLSGGSNGKLDRGEDTVEMDFHRM